MIYVTVPSLEVKYFSYIIFLDVPKSITLRVGFSDTVTSIRLSNFRSLWTILALWQYYSADSNYLI